MIIDFIMYLQTKLRSVQDKLETDKLNIEIKANKRIELSDLDYIIAHDLKHRIKLLQDRNREYLLKKYYIPYFQKTSKDVDKYIIDDSIALCQANQQLNRDFATGMLDELYTESSYIEGINKRIKCHKEREENNDKK